MSGGEKQKIYGEAEAVLRNGRRVEAEGSICYTMPSPGSYPYQWLWDSCFHAIALAHIDPRFGQEELQTLLMRQFANGMVPHMTYWHEGPLHWYHWGIAGTSSITQPPMLAYATLRVFEKTQDEQFLQHMFQPLMNYYRYLLERRDPWKRGLVGIINPDESGEDNSPRFDALLHFTPAVSPEEHHARRFKLVETYRQSGFDESSMRDSFWVEEAGFNAILVANLDALAKLAQLVGHEEDAVFCREKSALVRDAMRTHLFEDGRFWSYAPFAHGGTRLKVATWTHFLPLFAGIYTPEEAKRVVEEDIRNEETFRAPFGIRTVSKREPAYSIGGYKEDDARAFGGDWRGAVWHAPHWFLFHGLNRYGFSDDAQWVRDMTHSLIARTGFREHIHPETGEGGGARDFTWGTLVLDME